MWVSEEAPLSLLCNLALAERRPEHWGQLQTQDSIEKTKRIFLRKAPIVGGLCEAFYMMPLPWGDEP